MDDSLIKEILEDQYDLFIDSNKLILELQGQDFVSISHILQIVSDILNDNN